MIHKIKLLNTMAKLGMECDDIVEELWYEEQNIVEQFLITLDRMCITTDDTSLAHVVEVETLHESHYKNWTPLWK